LKTPHISFFVIGAARSGTTSIFRALTSHPDVFLPEVKEPRFFAEHWKKGWEWYADIYRNAPKGAVCGDFSPSYTNASDKSRAAERIGRFYPDARILYMVRNPIECAISNWRMKAELSDENLSFRRALENGSWTFPVLHRSMFFKQLNFYRQYFSDEQILVAPLELIRTDPDAWIARIQKHLGLSDGHTTHFLKANASDRKPNRPTTPDIPFADRKHFLSMVAPDARALLDHLGHPQSLWNLSPSSPAWTKGRARPQTPPATPAA
jgi:Sulfotransferase domain